MATGWDIDDTDGIAYGISTYQYHFNMYIAGLVSAIDSNFNYVMYIGTSKTTREIHEQLDKWLKRTEREDKRKVESLKQPGTDIKESKKSKQPDEEESST